MKKIIVVLLFTFVVGCTSNKPQEIKHLNITYRENYTDYACITFYDKGKYSMYDCDSEPTNYFFDSENECKYKMKDNKIYFDCKYKNYDHSNYIEIIEWDENTFKFKMDDEIKVFKKVD